jgi:hypothetical protein
LAMSTCISREDGAEPKLDAHSSVSCDERSALISNGSRAMAFGAAECAASPFGHHDVSAKHAEARTKKWMIGRSMTSSGS